MRGLFALSLVAFAASSLALPADPPCEDGQRPAHGGWGHGGHGHGGMNTSSACPPDFKDAVLNNAGGLGANATFFVDAVLQAGAAHWLTFQLNITGATTYREIPMMAFASMVDDAVGMVNGPNPPEWLLTFNEPDYSYMNFTPTLTPQEAATAIQPLLANPGTRTKYVAPVTADPQSTWLPDFYAACNCQNFFSAYNIHVYQPTVADAQNEITTFHQKFSDKPLWVTEIAPGNANCALTWDQASQYMQQIYAWGVSVGWIDRIFWNTINEIPGDTNVCNSYLFDVNGYPSPLLATYANLTCT